MGKIGGYVGPLPYDMNECQVRTKELFSHVKKDINVDGITYKDVIFSCEMLSTSPEITFQ